MGSATMAFNKILVSVLLGSVAGQNTRTFPGFGLNSDVPSTTPVPILRYIDQQNNDGSYTYGYQSGDGSYKIETRLATGEVKGKYGYIDANGNLKETSYGAMADLGFQPIVDGVEYNVQVPEPAQNDIATNTIDFSSTNFVQKAAVVNNNNAGQFANFRPNNNNNAKIVNGRRAVLRKRLRVRPEDAIRPSDLQQQREEKEQIEAESREAALRAREEGLRARQEGLRVLEQQRAALRRLQGDLISGTPVRSQASRSFPAFQQQQQQRPAPANFQEAPRSDP